MKSIFSNYKNWLAVAVVAGLTACGGGGGASVDIGGGSTNADIQDAIEAAQYADGFVYGYDTTKPYEQAVPVDNRSGFAPDWTRSYRWNIERDGLIPVWGVEVSPLVSQALDEIEANMQMVVFDRTTLAGVAQADVKRGIVFKNGVPLTSGAEQDNCGASGTGWVDQSMSYVPPMPAQWAYMEDPANQFALLPNVSVRSQVHVTLNLASASCQGRMKDVAVHEIKHALGLRQHFTGFDSGVSYTMLRTLYRNPVGTRFVDLTIAQ